MARDPSSGTIYVAAKMTGFGDVGRAVGTLGPIGCTTEITGIGDNGQNIAALAWREASNQLWALTGDGALSPEGFCRLTLATGLGNTCYFFGAGDDGVAVA